MNFLTVPSGMPYLGSGGTIHEGEVVANKIRRIAGMYGIAVFASLILTYLSQNYPNVRKIILNFRSSMLGYVAYEVSRCEYPREEWTGVGLIMWEDQRKVPRKVEDWIPRIISYVEDNRAEDDDEYVTKEEVECARNVAVQYVAIISSRMLIKKHVMLNDLPASEDVTGSFRSAMMYYVQSYETELREFLEKMDLDTNEKRGMIGIDVCADAKRDM